MQEERRGGRRLTVLFWAGVGVAPLAALLLLFVDGDGSLRVATVLALLSVILIGLSVALRKDPEVMRGELEDALLDEIDALRDDVRHDIVTAARATHRQLSEKIHHLHESVETVRGELGPARLGYAHVEAAPAAVHGAAAGAGHGGPAGLPAGSGDRSAGMGRARIPAPVVGGGVVRHTETVQVTTRHTIVDPHGQGQSGRGTVYGGTVYGGRDADPAPAGRHGRSAEWSEPAEESWTEQRLRERFLAARASENRTDSRDRHGEARDDRVRSGPSGLAEDRAGEGRARPGDGAGREAWERWGDARSPERDEPSRGGRRSRAYDRDDDDPGDDERWSGMRAGDRWASVRTDDRGRELRMGERRAAVHSDESGTEMRIEDRWTSVRRDEPRPRWGDDPRSHRDDDLSPLQRGDDLRALQRGEDLGSRHRGDDRWEANRFDGELEEPTRGWDVREDWTDRAESRWERRALPAASSEPSWSSVQARGESDRVESGRVGRRRRRDDDDDYRDDDYRYVDIPEEPRSRRRVGYEPSDDRWR